MIFNFKMFFNFKMCFNRKQNMLKRKLCQMPQCSPFELKHHREFLNHHIKRFKASGKKFENGVRTIAKMYENKFFQRPLFKNDAEKLDRINDRYKVVTKILKKEFPGETFKDVRGKSFMLSMPRDLQEDRSRVSKSNTDKRIDNPVEIQADALIQLATQKLKLALEDEIAPEVLFWYNMLVPGRGNDVNIQHTRVNGEKCSSHTHVYLDEFPGTIAVLCPSKKKTGSASSDEDEDRPILSDDTPDVVDEETKHDEAFLTATIADPENYSLIKEALAFMLSDNAKLACYSQKTYYLERRPCGMQKSNEWSTSGIKRQMIDDSGIMNLINWHGNKKQIDANFNRAFCACVINKERIYFDRLLNVDNVAAEKALGHVPGSSSNRNYLRFSVRPSQIANKILKKVTTPILVNGVSISNGIYVDEKYSL